MLYLDKSRLESILSTRGLTLNSLAELCSISRQSIYNMFESTSVFNTTFEKIRQYLSIDYRAITTDKSVAFEIIKKSPGKIKIAAYKLFEYSKNNSADLLLFGSNYFGKFGFNHEWNFAIYFNKIIGDNKLNILRQELIDGTFPYTINLINLNSAPFWIKLIIKEKYIRLAGYTEEGVLFSSSD